MYSRCRGSRTHCQYRAGAHAAIGGSARRAHRALIAQGAETRPNTLQSAPRPDNDIGGRHMTVCERHCRRTSEKGRIASSPLRGVPPVACCSPPHSQPVTNAAPTAALPTITSYRRPRNSAKGFRAAILDRPSAPRTTPSARGGFASYLAGSCSQDPLTSCKKID